ncbi:MAG: HU family DNA-binding protein [Actinobacteria bacterium]|nr:HU family DNA-binding protein [Actinomycetota bacterium]
MAKQELAQKAAADAHIAGALATSAVDAAFDAIASELAAGHDVAIAGFGKFSVSERAARDGRNPASGETIQIAASTVAKFSAAAALKKQLNS